MILCMGRYGKILLSTFFRNSWERGHINILFQPEYRKKTLSTFLHSSLGEGELDILARPTWGCELTSEAIPISSCVVPDPCYIWRCLTIFMYGKV